MRKIRKEFLEKGVLHDPKKHVVVWKLFFKKNWIYLFLMVFTSCSVQNGINKDDYQRIPKQFSARFYDKVDTIRYENNMRFFTKGFLKDLSDVDAINYSEPIQIEITEDKLFLKFKTTDQQQYVLQFYGKLYRKKFVFYTNYKTITFPLLFISKEMSRYSIYLPSNDELLVENDDVNEGMVLFLGAGHTSGSNYKFKLLKNE
jgi:hypothetical protein